MMSKDSMEGKHLRQEGTPTAEAAPTTTTFTNTNTPVLKETDDAILHPGPHDVLMGRGAPSTDFTGNLRFRELVKERRHDYVNAKRRKDKQGVAGEIIATVKQRGGRFLSRTEAYRKVKGSSEPKKVTVWEPVEDRKTLLVKVKQLMRDVGPVAQQKRNLRRQLRRQRELDALANESSDEEGGESLSHSGNTSMTPATLSRFQAPKNSPLLGGMSGGAANSMVMMNNSAAMRSTLHPGGFPQFMSPMVNGGAFGDSATLRQRLQQEMAAREMASLRQEIQLRRELHLRQELQQRQSMEALAQQQGAVAAPNAAATSAQLVAAQKEQLFRRHQLQQEQQLRAASLLGGRLPLTGGEYAGVRPLPPLPSSAMASLLRQQQQGPTDGLARFQG